MNNPHLHNEYLDRLIRILENPEDHNSIEIKYSLNYLGEKNYTLNLVINSIDKIIFVYGDFDLMDDLERENIGCRYCGNGEYILYVVLLNDNKYALLDLWTGCLTYGSHGNVIISESPEDLENMCMTNTQRNIYNENRSK